jgi:PAS domain S-box-containing protein
MANWLASTDAVLLFTGSTILDCNEACLRLFACSSKEEFLAQTPVGLLLQEQPDSLSAPERLMMLVSQAQEEGFCKGAVIGRKSDGSGFYVNLVIMPETTATAQGRLYCTKWLPMRSFELGQVLPEELYWNEPVFSNNTGLLQVNDRGEILEVNETLSSWLGYTPNELMNGFCLKKLLQDEKAFDQHHELQGGIRDGRVKGLVLKAKNGSLLTLKAIRHQVNGSGIIRLLLKQQEVQQYEQEFYWHEIERLKRENRNLKRVQRVLQKGMERMRVLAEYSPDVIMQYDRQHRHLFVNSQVESQISFKVEDFLGKTHQQMGFPEAFSRICEEAIDRVFSSGQRHRMDLELPNGHWIDWILIPEFGPAGEVVSVITTARDITEQKHTAFELEKSQQKLKDAFSVTKLSSWEYCVAEDQLLLNEQLCDLLSIEDSLHQISGTHFLNEFFLPEEKGKLLYLLWAASDARHEDFREVIDYRLRRRDGAIIHVLSSIRLELNAGGEIVRAFGTAQDITLLRLTEQELEEYRTGLEQLVETRTLELRKSEEKLADALRLANLGTWEFDPVIDCFLVSDNVLEIFGATREIEGGTLIPVSRIRETVFPEDWLKYLKTVERVYAAKDEFYTEHLDIRIRHSDGDIRHLYVSIKTGKTRNFIKYYGTLQDITRIRQTEHEKDRLTAIIETTSDIVGIADVDGQILYMNRAGKEFFGLQQEELLPQKNLNSFRNYKFSNILSRKGLRHADTWGTWSGQNRYLRHDGNEVHVSQVIVSHKNDQGQVQCYSTILRDMSEQKKIEQDLIFKNNELDTFIYRASHDLRGPIATLMGLNQIVRYEVTDPAAIGYFDLYNSQIVRLHNITVSLIELTKIKDRTCEISEIDFSALWQNVGEDIDKLPESADVQLHDQIEEIRGFSSDAHLLQIIVYNLIENSIRYRRGEVESYARVDIQKTKDTEHVVIKVSDNGIGIDGGLQNKIYNMFFRGTERSKGPGLGLYILKNAVEKLHGRITLFSVPYKGTTFKIELPPLVPETGLPA